MQSLRSYSEFQISDGAGGSAFGEAAAVFSGEHQLR